MASAQTPEVAITIENVTRTTITASFAANASCTGYYMYAAKPGVVETWAGTSVAIEDVVRIHGMYRQGDTTRAWTGLMPGETYVLYALAVGTDSRHLSTDTAAMLPIGGGSGASVMTVTVSDITSSSATLTCTPNDQTARFKDMIFPKEDYDAMGADSVISILKEDYYTYYETDEWTWSGLDFNAEYIMCAIGQNANDEWGELATAQFTTLMAGGQGLSTIAIDTNFVTDYWAQVHLTPNDQTVRYWVMYGKLSLVESLPDEEILSQLQMYGCELSGPADFDMTALDSGVCYVAVAVGQNGNHEFGEVARLTINCSTEGVAEAEDSPLALYPNPATSFVKVEGLEPQSQVTLYDVQGRQLLNFRAEAADMTLNISGYAKGLYLLKVVGNGHTRTATLVVE